MKKDFMTEKQNDTQEIIKLNKQIHEQNLRYTNKQDSLGNNSSVHARNYELKGEAYWE